MKITQALEFYRKRQNRLFDWVILAQRNMFNCLLSVESYLEKKILLRKLKINHPHQIVKKLNFQHDLFIIFCSKVGCVSCYAIIQKSEISKEKKRFNFN